MSQTKRTRRVVIVDDEQSGYMETIQHLLSLRGFEVLWLRSVDDCIAFLDSRRRAALFIMDVTLPTPEACARYATVNNRYTGIPLARVVRRRRKHPPIVLLANITRERGESLIEELQKHLRNSVFLMKWANSPTDLASTFTTMALTGKAMMSNRP